MRSAAQDAVQRAQALGPMIAAAGAQIEAERRLPATLVAAIAEAGFFRLLLPRVYGGGETDPLTFVAVIEEIAKHDGSTAWCLCQTAVCAMVAAYLPAETARDVFGEPGAILAWGAGFVGRAVAAPGGFRLTGTWPFASGGRHATWFGGHSVVYGPDGRECRGADGLPLLRTLLFPAAKAAMTDVWQVVGLRGTGSDTYAVTDLFVPEAYAAPRDEGAERRYDAPLYRLRTTQMFACGFAGVALGLARALLDSFIALAREKSPRGLRPLRDSAAAQTDLGVWEARWRGARAYLFAALGAVWERARAGHELTLDDRVALRLAATQAIQEARAVANDAYHAAGATAIFASQPFERRFRDMNAVAQQVQARRSHFETAGRHLLGLEVDTGFL